ncbi:hypothetical protein [Streptomyces vilmorinianum]|uniref:hypothetical protein n=1 Tax=Streptomyces vilmorinianum TaxID=3051092 RepID=UPI0010FB16D1|nr:hypothetical protein [Streptomyces vilmorinianum]
MHDPEAQHEWMDFDFGVTALGASFHGDWVLDAEDELDYVRRYLGAPEGDPTGLTLLIEDILRLRNSGLDGEELNLLWRATDPPHGGSPAIRGAERAWLERLLDELVPLARSSGASEADCTSYPACGVGGANTPAVEHRRLATEVVELVGMLDQRQDWSREPLEQTRDALVRCAETVCSELAFRFLLRAANQFCSRLSPETYGRLERLGAAFGYGPHVVDAVRYLVD